MVSLYHVQFIDQIFSHSQRPFWFRLMERHVVPPLAPGCLTMSV
jgi:hypothetical protein